MPPTDDDDPPTGLDGDNDPAPDWESMQPLLSSVDVARMLGILPKTLSKYVQRGTMRQPVERGTNHALYRKEDVREFWKLREYRKAQGYIKARRLIVGGEEAATGPETAPDVPPTDGVTMSRQDLAGLLTAAVAEGVRLGNEELKAEIAALRKALAPAQAPAIPAPDAESPEAPDENSVPRTPPTQPPTKSWWDRLLGR